MELITAISPDTTFCGMPLKDVIQVAWGKKSVAQCERENPGMMPSYLEEVVEMFRQVYELESDIKHQGDSLTAVTVPVPVWKLDSRSDSFGWFYGVPFTEVIQIAWGQRTVAECMEANHSITASSIEKAVTHFRLACNLNVVVSDKDAAFDRCTLGLLQADRGYRTLCGLRIARNDYGDLTKDELTKFQKNHLWHHAICMNNSSHPHGADWWYLNLDLACMKGATNEH